jgi:hypothetical protein
LESSQIFGKRTPFSLAVVLRAIAISLGFDIVGNTLDDIPQSILNFN